MILRIESTEYLYVPVNGATGLGDLDVYMVLLEEDAKPTSEDWVTASWSGSDSAGWTARLLVGPTGDQTISTAGTYVPWVRVDNDPESVIMATGPISIV